jgi:AcrR family transcriptional regulator
MADAGYAATTMRGVAAAAGVSVKTVEAAFGTKANLLTELIDVAIAGDDEPVPLAERDAVARMVAEPDPRRLLELNAHMVADISRRLAAVDRALAEAAAHDPGLEGLLQTSLANRMEGARQMIEVLASRTPLRVAEDEAVDTAWLLLDPHHYRVFTTYRGWSHERYVAWLTDVQVRLLLPD